MPNLPDTTEQIIAAFEEGLSVSDISEAFGLSTEAVHARLERAGIDSKVKERSAKEEQDRKNKARVIAMVRKGFRTSTISKMTGVSLPKVKEIVNKSYIITRDHSGSEVLIPRHEKNRIERPRNRWWVFRSRGND
jgi:DNA invertase Pin-like site-specific DNA recombinase